MEVSLDIRSGPVLSKERGNQPQSLVLVVFFTCCTEAKSIWRLTGARGG